MNTSEQLERETEETRAQISATLDELRARMSVGQVVDQLVDYASDSTGGMFFHNLRRQVANNPLPVVLMGAGLAWLAMSNRRPTNGVGVRRDSLSAGRAGNSLRETSHAWADQAKSASREWSESARESASDVRDAARAKVTSAADAASQTYQNATARAGDAAARLQGAARSAADSMMETASNTYEGAAEQASRASQKIKQSASHMRSNLADTTSSMKTFLNDQPLVLAGMGIAMGAIIGAALPSTTVEDELMGEESDKLKQKSAELAEGQMVKASAVAAHALDAAKQEAEEQDLVSAADDNASEPVKAERGDGELKEHGELKELDADEASVLPSAGGSPIPEHERNRH